MSRFGLNTYSKKLIHLPLPQYIVFYNGREDQPDEMELKLSDAFIPPVDFKQKPMLECRVRMLNINIGHNQDLMQNCRKLWEYARFVEEVNQNLDSGYPLDQAAIDTCIRQDVLKEILIQSRSEVLLMFLTEYDQKLHLKHTFAEGHEEGLEQGLEQGQSQVFMLYQKLLEEDRLDDWKKALTNESYREELLKELSGAVMK